MSPAPGGPEIRTRLGKGGSAAAESGTLLDTSGGHGRWAVEGS